MSDVASVHHHHRDSPAAPAQWEEIAIWGMLTTGAAVAAVPLWSVDLLPFQDLPGHLATVRVLMELGDPGSLLAPEYFRPNWLLPNALFFYITAALAKFMPIVTACKVVFTAYVLAFPTALAWMFRALGRSPWLALPSLFMIYSDPFGYGFASYALGLPLLFIWVGWAHRHALSPTLRLGVALAGGLVMLFLSHAQIFLTAGLIGTVLVALSWDGWAVLWRRVWPYVLGSVPFLAWMLRFFVFPPKQGQAEVTFGGFRSETGFQWASPRTLLDELRTDVLMGFESQTDEVALLAIGFSILVLLVGRARPRGHRAGALEAITLAAAAAFVVLPLHMKGQALISSRFLPLAVALLPAWGRMPRSTPAAAALALALFGGSVWYHVKVAHHFQVWQAEEAGDLRGLMGMLGREHRLAFLRPDRAHRVVDRGSSWYLDSYHMVLNGGLARIPFHLIYPHHTVVRPNRALPRVDERRINRFPRSSEAARYTHALVFSDTQPRFGHGESLMKLMGQTGKLWLYAYEPPAPPPPPSLPRADPGPEIGPQQFAPFPSAESPLDERAAEPDVGPTAPQGEPL